MKYFEQIKASVDIRPLLQEIERQQDIWGEQTGRQNLADVQCETESVPIRGLKRSGVYGRRKSDVGGSRYTKLSRRLPKIVAFIEAFAEEQDADLAHAKLAKIPAGNRVYPHVDCGEYFRMRDRYHLILKSPNGSPLISGGEKVRMQEGELWWFDNKQSHEAYNDSDGDRIHLIFDIEARDPAKSRSRAYAGGLFDVGEDGLFLDLDDALNAARHSVARLRRAQTRGSRRIGKRRAEIVQMGVRLYAAGRDHPEAWRALLDEEGVLDIANKIGPFRAIAQMLMTDFPPKARLRIARSMPWALRRIESRELDWDSIVSDILAMGGVKSSANAWRRKYRMVAVKEMPVAEMTG